MASRLTVKSHIIASLESCDGCCNANKPISRRHDGVGVCGFSWSWTPPAQLVLLGQYKPLCLGCAITLEQLWRCLTLIGGMMNTGDIKHLNAAEGAEAVACVVAWSVQDWGRFVRLSSV